MRSTSSRTVDKFIVRAASICPTLSWSSRAMRRLSSSCNWSRRAESSFSLLVPQRFIVATPRFSHGHNDDRGTQKRQGSHQFLDGEDTKRLDRRSEAIRRPKDRQYGCEYGRPDAAIPGRECHRWEKQNVAD